ncbi:MAG: EamA family transporter [Ktedonobacteraceae bacterium]
MKKSIRSSEQTSRLQGYFMVIAASTLFGVNGSLSRFLLDSGISPVTLVEFRMLFGWLVLCALLLVSKQIGGLRSVLQHWGRVVMYGISLALVTFTYFLAISRIPIAITLVIQFSASAWMVLGESIWRRKFPPRVMVIAILLSICGVVLVTDVWRVPLSGLDGPGLLYAFFALLTYIAFLILGRHVGERVPALQSTTWGAFVASIFWLIIQPPWTIPTGTWQTGRVLLMVLVGVIGMAVPFALVQNALRRIDATRVGIAAMFELVAGGVVAYFWLGQHLNAGQISGCVLVLVGIAILQYER